MRLPYVRIGLGIAALLACLVCSAAWGATVAVVLSDRTPGYLDVARAMTSDLERYGVGGSEFVQFSGPEWAESEANPTGAAVKLIVTLGAEALRKALAREPRAPVLAVLVPRNGFERIVKEAGRKAAFGISAIYLDQPFGRRLDLLKIILPEAKNVGVLWGSESVASEPLFLQAAQTRGLAVQGSLVSTSGSIFSGLKAAIDKSDVLMATPDPQVYNSSTIANILVATYRAGIPVMAFSAAYVKAGALIAVYSTPNQIGIQASAMVRRLLLPSSPVAHQYPVEFEISVNEHVAQSLGLNLDVNAITVKLQSMGKRP